MNWTLIPVGLLLLALVIFLIVRNQKDKKELENKLANDYRKSKEEENDTETEERLK